MATNIFELLQATLIHGRMDVTTAITLKTCGKEFADVVTFDMIKFVSEKDYVSPVMWLARLVHPKQKSFHPEELKDIREKARRGDIDIIRKLIEDDSIYFDMDIHTKVLDTCFDFEFYDSKEAVDKACITFCHVFLTKFNEWNEKNSTHIDMVIAYTLLTSIIIRVISWAIINNITKGDMPLMTHVPFISGILNKILYMYGFTNRLQHEKINEIKIILKAAEKYVKAWRFSLTTNTQLYIGPKGGVFNYTNTNTIRKHYWR